MILKNLYLLFVSEDRPDGLFESPNEILTFIDKYRKDLSVKYINWMREPLKDGDSIRCNVKIRYRHEPEPASVTMVGDTAEIIFDEPQRAITTGQAAVFYDGDMVIGGGTIIKL